MAAKGKGRSPRRSEDEMIAELEEKIRSIEERKRRKEHRQSPVAKDFERFKKHAAKFVQSCVDHERHDIANSVLGLLNTTERQVK
ncbi:MAG: hypothetical protein AAFP86_16305, partial [Planctomycetota bacterium]